MKMKTLKNILVATCLVLSCSSCKKFLEEHPKSVLTPDADLSSAKVARAFANGAYQNFSGILAGQPGSYGGNTWNLMEFMTGKANSDLGQTGFVNFQTLIYSNTSFYFDTWWQQMYLGIGACNLALEDLSTLSAGVVSDSTKVNMLAQAHALRALYYFYLVRLYGAVPKVTDVPKDLNLNLPRTPA